MEMQKFTNLQLSKKQMNLIKGGGAFFKCECNGPNNSPYIPEWEGFYQNTDDMAADITIRCQNGGSCSR
ncbi:MAG: hypothetical protein RR555_10110 [Bacteroidales bacterium]